jgi:predicted DNA-binding protein (MmcQ/YjbR family)
MNKKHWITLLLDDELDISEIKRWIDESHELVAK